METILERQRNAHEDIERMEQAIANRMLAQPRTIRDKLQLEHEIADMVERIGVRARGLKEMYADADGSRAKEIADLSAGGGLDSFYKQFGMIKEFHQRYKDVKIEDLEAEYAIRLPEPNKRIPDDDRIATMFSGEEGYGRYFDLIALHSEFVNLKRNRPVTYLRYLDIFDVFDDTTVPAPVKQDAGYEAYLSNLLTYLRSFYQRAMPLDDHKGTISVFEQAFEEQWKPVEGIYCNICQKMYSKQTVYDGHLISKKHKAGLEGNATPAVPKQAHDSKKEVARLEFVISQLVQKFITIKSATKSNVARKQTLTDKEWQAEQDASYNITILPDKEEEEEVIEQDTDKIYNPLKLPLGWDGKPIPFWLWRLHGLGVEYPCEICGNYVYMGRKAYDKHFVEFRHVHGLRCLGIANSPVFEQITNIADAIALNERLDVVRRQEQKKHDETIEMEDENGNIMNAALYNELRRQGVL